MDASLNSGLVSLACCSAINMLCMNLARLGRCWNYWNLVLKAAEWIVGSHYSYTCITGTTYWSPSNRPM